MLNRFKEDVHTPSGFLETYLQRHRFSPLPLFSVCDEKLKISVSAFGGKKWRMVERQQLSFTVMHPAFSCIEAAFIGYSIHPNESLEFIVRHLRDSSKDNSMFLEILKSVLFESETEGLMGSIPILDRVMSLDIWTSAERARIQEVIKRLREAEAHQLQLK